MTLLPRPFREGGRGVRFPYSGIGLARPTIWQRLPAGSSTWVNLSDGTGFTGTTTANLFGRSGSFQSGDQFRVVVTNSSGVNFTEG